MGYTTVLTLSNMPITANGFLLHNNVAATSSGCHSCIPNLYFNTFLLNCLMGFTAIRSHERPIPNNISKNTKIIIIHLPCDPFCYYNLDYIERGRTYILVVYPISYNTQRAYPTSHSYLKNNNLILPIFSSLINFKRLRNRFSTFAFVLQSYHKKPLKLSSVRNRVIDTDDALKLPKNTFLIWTLFATLIYAVDVIKSVNSSNSYQVAIVEAFCPTSLYVFLISLLRSHYGLFENNEVDHNRKIKRYTGAIWSILVLVIILRKPMVRSTKTVWYQVVQTFLHVTLLFINESDRPQGLKKIAATCSSLFIYFLMLSATPWSTLLHNISITFFKITILLASTLALAITYISTSRHGSSFNLLFTLYSIKYCILEYVITMTLSYKLEVCCLTSAIASGVILRLYHCNKIERTSAWISLSLYILKGLIVFCCRKVTIHLVISSLPLILGLTDNLYFRKIYRNYKQVLLWSFTIVLLSNLAAELLENICKMIFRFIGLQLSSTSFGLILSAAVIYKGAISIPSLSKHHKNTFFSLSICLNLLVILQPDYSIESLANFTKIFMSTGDVSPEDIFCFRWSLIILTIIVINLSMQTVDLEKNRFRIVAFAAVFGICSGAAYTVKFISKSHRNAITGVCSSSCCATFIIYYIIRNLETKLFTSKWIRCIYSLFMLNTVWTLSIFFGTCQADFFNQDLFHLCFDNGLLLPLISETIVLHFLVGGASKYKRLWNPSVFRYENEDSFMEIIGNISILLAYVLLQLILFWIPYSIRALISFPLLSLLNLNISVSQKLQGRDTIFLAVSVTIVQLFVAAFITVIPDDFTLLNIGESLVLTIGLLAAIAILYCGSCLVLSSKPLQVYIQVIYWSFPLCFLTLCYGANIAKFLSLCSIGLTIFIYRILPHDKNLNIYEFKNS
ncbi:hypothetical protein TrispH2_004894 [Trichoplax sp. H2]|nr:hypothetical protein TrispH2_004894 [Trichoplax sp. H2]|eukprot:RDD42938.1 hypothetical protein TrispH2_004894 [Trichoplax sp. H2]